MPGAKTAKKSKEESASASGSSAGLLQVPKVESSLKDAMPPEAGLDVFDASMSDEEKAEVIKSQQKAKGAKPAPLVPPMQAMAEGFAGAGNIDKMVEDLKMYANVKNVAEGVVSTGADILDTASKIDGGTGVSKASAWVGLPLSSVKALVGAYELVKMAFSKEDFDSVEGGILLAETVKSAVEGVSTIIEKVEKAPPGIADMVPPLAIAIAVVKILRNGLYFSTSLQQKKIMSDQHQALLKSNPDFEKVIEFYRKKDALASNQKYVISMDSKRLGEAGLGEEKKTELTQRIQKTMQEVKATESIVHGSGLKREDVRELALVLELESANNKRVKRQSIAIVADIAKIAGNIAILSGGGAIAGAVVNASASALEVGTVGTRGAKQMGRDRAARKEAKGKGGSKVFDTSKSTVAKSDYRIEQVQTLVELIVELSKLESPPAGRIDMVGNYVKATGVDTAKLYKINGKPKPQVKMLYDAVCKRDA